MEGERTERSAVVFERDEQREGIEIEFEIEKGGIFGIPEIEAGGDDGRNREAT